MAAPPECLPDNLLGGRARHGLNNLDHRGGRVIERPLYQRGPRARGPGVLLLHGVVCVLSGDHAPDTRLYGDRS